MTKTKTVSYAYATSSDADRFRFKDGCYVVNIQDGTEPPVGVAGFQTAAEAQAYADTLPMPAKVGPGMQFRRPDSTVNWTVLRYHRNDAWICEEARYRTTCEFYAHEILAGKAFLEAISAQP